MISTPPSPRIPCGGQWQGLRPSPPGPVSALGIITVRAPNTPPAHTNTCRSAAVTRPSARLSHPAEPAESANPHKVTCWARGFLHGRLSYASARNPKPFRPLRAQFSSSTCRPSANPAGVDQRSHSLMRARTGGMPANAHSFR